MENQADTPESRALKFIHGCLGAYPPKMRREILMALLELNGMSTLAKKCGRWFVALVHPAEGGDISEDEARRLVTAFEELGAALLSKQTGDKPL